MKLTIINHTPHRISSTVSQWQDESGAVDIVLTIHDDRPPLAIDVGEEVAALFGRRGNPARRALAAADKAPKKGRAKRFWRWWQR